MNLKVGLALLLLVVAVAIGHYTDGKFQAEQLLVKCPAKYQAEAEKGRNRS